MGVHEQVIFDRPDLSALRVDNPNHAFVDMHHHTRHSDAYTRVKALLKRAKAKGIGVAVTDHNAIAGSVEAYRTAEDALVIPGIEVGCREGPHFLVYFYHIAELREFYEKFVAPYKNGNPYHNLSIGMADLLSGAKRYNSVVTAAHPSAPGYFHLLRRIAACKVDPAVLQQLDAFEVCSGQSFRKMNERTISLAENFGKAFVGGSDGHVLSALGSTITHAKAATVTGFLRTIKQQRNHVVGWEMPLVQRVHPYSGMSVKYLRYPSTLPYYYRYHVREHMDRLKPQLSLLRAKASTAAMAGMMFFFKRNM